MKKTFYCLCSILIIIQLGACADRKDDRTPDHRTNTIYEDGELGRNKSNHTEPQEQLLSKDTPSKDGSISSDGYLPNDIAILEEIPTIKQHLELQDLVAEVESDIPNKRIILFKSNETNDENYKSIFIKSAQQLQIIDLKNDREIYKGQLQDS